MAFDRHRPSTDEDPAPAFSCAFCVRPEDIETLPTVDETGARLHPSDVLEIYNDRRYRHYLDDFGDASALRRHLEARARHWSFGRPAAEVAMALLPADATVGWWQIAKPAHDAGRRRILTRDPTEAELAEEAKQPGWADLHPEETPWPS